MTDRPKDPEISRLISEELEGEELPHEGSEPLKGEDFKQEPISAAEWGQEIFDNQEKFNEEIDGVFEFLYDEEQSRDSDFEKFSEPVLKKGRRTHEDIIKQAKEEVDEIERQRRAVLEKFKFASDLIARNSMSFDEAIDEAERIVVDQEGTGGDEERISRIEAAKTIAISEKDDEKKDSGTEGQWDRGDIDKERQEWIDGQMNELKALDTQDAREGRALELTKSNPELFFKACFTCEFSNEDIERLLSEMGPETSREVLEQTRLSKPERRVSAESLRQENAAAIENHETEQISEAKERVEKFRQVGEQIFAAAEKMHGKEYAERLKERMRTREILQNAPIREIQDLTPDDPSESAVSRPVLIFFEGRNLPAIGKLASREERGYIIPETLEYGYSLPREELAGLEAVAMGFEDAVPETASRTTDEMPDVPISLQDWYISEPMGRRDYIAEFGNDDTKREQAAIISLLRKASRNIDGHSGNTMVAADNGLKAIDNAYSRFKPPENLDQMPEEQRRVGHGNDERNHTLWITNGKPLSETTKAKIEKFLDKEQSAAVREPLSQLFRDSFGDDAEYWEEYRDAVLRDILENGLPRESEREQQVDMDGIPTEMAIQEKKARMEYMS